MAFQLYTNDLCDDGMCNMVIYTDDIILYSKCDGAFGLWEQLELASEIDSGLGNTGLVEVDCNSGKTQLVLFDQLNNVALTFLKVDSSDLIKNGLKRCQDYLSRVNCLICRSFVLLRKHLFQKFVMAGAPKCYLDMVEKLRKLDVIVLVLHTLLLLHPGLIVEKQPTLVFSIDISLGDIKLS